MSPTDDLIRDLIRLVHIKFDDTEFARHAGAAFQAMPAEGPCKYCNKTTITKAFVTGQDRIVGEEYQTMSYSFGEKTTITIPRSGDFLYVPDPNDYDASWHEDEMFLGENVQPPELRESLRKQLHNADGTPNYNVRLAFGPIDATCLCCTRDWSNGRVIQRHGLKSAADYSSSSSSSSSS